jgi:CheY-like chemotaxis protein
MPEQNDYSILLIEDDEVDILNVQRVFRKKNFTNPLHVAHNGVEALDLLRGTNGVTRLSPLPRVILLDINMPQMNGLEFLRELRDDAGLRHLSAFVLTTSSDPNDLREAYAKNVAGYVVKPIDFEHFSSTIEALHTFWNLCVYP